MQPTDQHKALVKATFRKIVPISERTVRAFYDRLFELDPSARAMFKGDIKEQARKFLQMLAVIVGGLEHIEEIRPSMGSLGKRHATYGVTAQQYAIVGEALLWAVERALGADYTPEVSEAWHAVYDMLSVLALEGIQA